MTNLSPWGPFRDMMTLRDAMDRLFEQALIAPSASGQGMSVSTLPVDMTECEDSYIVKAAIPGMKPDDLDISVTQNVLTIKGEVKADEETKDARYYLRERRWGSFARTVELPAPVKADAVAAEYVDGVLHLTLPKADEVRPKRISIRGGEQQQKKLVEGQAKTK
jgi:HSP20 family protein